MQFGQNIEKKNNPKARGNVDVEIGGRIRILRKSLHMSQSLLAQSVGMTYQQIQKYECGINRISVSALLAVAKALNADPSSLLGGLADAKIAETGSFPVAENISPQARLLTGLFCMLTDSADREVVLGLASHLVKKAYKKRDNIKGKTSLEINELQVKAYMSEINL